MNYNELLKSHYQNTRWDDIQDEDLLDEAIRTLENHFNLMDKDDLIKRSRPLAIAYLALVNEKERRQLYDK